MPIGPVHRGRGGSGRDGGGGSSSGGNLFGAILGGVIGGALTAGARKRRRERYYNRRHHNHNDYHDHNDDYEDAATPSRRRPTKWLTLTFVTLLIMFFTFMIRNGFVRSSEINADDVTRMETEWVSDYKVLIDKAKEQEDKDNLDPEKTHFITTAYVSQYSPSIYPDDPTVSGAYKSFVLNGVPYYFLVYEFTDHKGVEHKAQRTYAQFSGTQASSYTGKSALRIAYTFHEDDLVSINLNYELEDCAQYLNAIAQAEGNKILANYSIIAIVVEALIAGLFIYIFIRKYKKYKALVHQDEEAYAQKQQAEVSEAQAKAESAQKEADQKNRVCAFCGSTVPDNEPSCPACGSSVFE